MQPSTIRRLPDRVAELSLQMRLPKPHADLPDRQIVPLERPPYAIKLPYGGYRGAELWPDGELRINNPVRSLDADREMLSIIEALSVLNRMVIYSAFYNYAPHVGTLTVNIYEGRWTCFKKPVLNAAIDCRRFPLRDNDTEETVPAGTFMNRQILLAQ